MAVSGITYKPELIFTKGYRSKAVFSAETYTKPAKREFRNPSIFYVALHKRWIGEIGAGDICSQNDLSISFSEKMFIVLR